MKKKLLPLLLLASLTGKAQTITSIQQVNDVATFTTIKDARVRYDGSDWVRKSGTVTSSTPGYGAIVLAGPSGAYYQRDYVGPASAAWFGVKTDDADMGPELQAAVNAVNDLYIPDGSYTQLTPVNMRSNVIIHANPGKAIINLPNQYISLNNAWDATLLENITIDGLSWTVTSNQRVDGSYGPVTIDGPSLNNITIKNCFSQQLSSTCNVNAVFFKIGNDRSWNGVTVKDNRFVNHRMGVEFIGQFLKTPYRGKYIAVKDNRIEGCGFGVSVAGTFDGVEVDHNYFKDCPTYAIEYAGALRNARLTNNQFEGTFGGSIIALNWTNNGDGQIKGGYYIAGNSTVDTCNAKMEWYGGGAIQCVNNKFLMTGPLVLFKFASGGTFTGNTIFVKNTNYAVKFQDCTQNKFSSNYISNETFSGNFATVFASGSAANNLITNNTVVQYPGAGSWLGTWPAINGAFKAYNNYDKNGNPLNAGSAAARVATVSGANGEADFAGDGVKTQFVITHGLGYTPSFFSADAGSMDASNIQYSTADDTSITVFYATPPPASGSGNNLKIVWSAK